MSMLNKTLNRLKRKVALAGLSVLTLGGVSCKDDIVNHSNKPTAKFTMDPGEGYAPINVCFDGSSSTAPGSSIVKYIWTFEPGIKDSTSGARPCYNYQNPGEGNVGLVVEDANGRRSSQKLEQIIRRDGSPVINIANISFNEGGADTLNLNGLISSPLYPASALTINATSPDLSVELNNLQLVVTAKDHLPVLAKDWNGSSYIDLTVTDPDSRQPTSRMPVSVCAQTDI